MVQFNELRFIAPTLLQVNAQIIDLPYYDKVYIDEIIIDTEDTYCETGPSQNPPFRYQVGDGTFKKAKYVFDVADLLCDGPKMLFVWVTTLGSPSMDTPCGMDKPATMQAVVDLSTIYEEAMRKIRCASSGCGCTGRKCSIDADYANFALQYFRMETALSVKDWGTAYQAYCVLLRKRPSKKIVSNPRKPCGCNG